MHCAEFVTKLTDFKTVIGTSSCNSAVQALNLLANIVFALLNSVKRDLKLPDIIIQLNQLYSRIKAGTTFKNRTSLQTSKGTMRKSRLKDYIAGILIGASSIFSPASNVAVAQETKQEASIDDLTQSEVDRLMLRESVDDILKEEYDSGRIQKVVYNSSSGRTNFRELVYQEHLPASQRKPVIMLVADAIYREWLKKDGYVANKGDAIAVKKLAQKYDKFKIVLYDPTVDPEFKGIGEGKAKLGKELKGESVSSTPFIAMYWVDNQNHDFQKVYSFKGGPVGPSANKGVLELLEILNKEIKSKYSDSF